MDITNKVTTEFDIEDKSASKIFDMADAFKTAIANAKSLGSTIDDVSRIQNAYAVNIRSMEDHLSRVSSLSSTAKKALSDFSVEAQKSSTVQGPSKLLSSLQAFSQAVASDQSAFSSVSRSLSNIIVQGNKAAEALNNMNSSAGSSVKAVQQAIGAKLVAGSTYTPDLENTYKNMQAQVSSLYRQRKGNTADVGLKQQFIEAKVQLAALAEEYDAYAQKAMGADSSVTSAFLKQTKNIQILSEYVQKLNALYSEQQQVIETSGSTAKVNTAYKTQLEVQKEIEAVMGRVKKIKSGTVDTGDSSILSFLTGRNASSIQNVITNLSKFGIISPQIARVTSGLSLLNTTLTGTSGIAATLAFAGLGGLAIALVKGGGAALKAAADFQEYRVTLQALSTTDWSGNTKGTTTSIMGVGTAVSKEGIEYAAKTGYNVDKVSNALERLVGYGIDMREVNSDMEMLGNLSLGSSKRLENLAVAYGQVFGQGKARAQEMYQFVNAGIPIFDLLAKKLSTVNKTVTTADIMDMTRKGKVSFELIKSLLTDLTEAGGRYADIMERITGMSVNRQTEAFGTQLKLLLSNIANNLLPSVTSLLKEVNGVLDRMNKGFSVSAYRSDIQKAVATGSSSAVNDVTSARSTSELNTFLDPLRIVYTELMNLRSAGALNSGKYRTLYQGLGYASEGSTDIEKLLRFLPTYYSSAKTVQGNFGDTFSAARNVTNTMAEYMPKTSVTAAQSYLESSGLTSQQIVTLVMQSLGDILPSMKSALSLVQQGKIEMPIDLTSLSKYGASTSQIESATYGLFNGASRSNIEAIIAAQLSSLQQKPESMATNKATLSALQQRSSVTSGTSGLLDETDTVLGSLNSKLAEYNKKLETSGATYLAINPSLQEFVKIQSLYNTDMDTMLTLQDKYPGKTDKIISAMRSMAKELGLTEEQWRKITTVAGGKSTLEDALVSAREKAVSLYQAEQQLLLVQKTFTTFQGDWNPFKTVYNTQPDAVNKSRQVLIDKGVSDLQQSTKMFDPSSEETFRKIVTEQVDFTQKLADAKIDASDVEKSFNQIYTYMHGLDFGKATTSFALDNVELIARAMGESVESARKLLNYLVQVGGTKVPLDAYANALQTYQKNQSAPGDKRTLTSQQGLLADMAVYKMAASERPTYSNYFTDAQGGQDLQYARNTLIKSATGVEVSQPKGWVEEQASSKMLQPALDNYNQAYTTMMAASPGTSEWVTAASDVEKYSKQLTHAAKAMNTLSSAQDSIKQSAISLAKDGFQTTFKTLGEGIASGEDEFDTLKTAFKNLAATFMDNVSSVLISVAAGFAQAGQPWLALAALAAAGLASVVSGIISYSSSEEDDNDDTYLQALENLQDQLDTFMDQFRETLKYVDEARQAYVAAQQLATVGYYAKGDVFSNGTTLEQGVYNQPTMFAFAKGAAFDNVGQLAEAGKEAVMPLATGPDGSLGVQTYGSGSSGSGDVAISMPINITNESGANVDASTDIDADGNTQLKLLITNTVKSAVASGSMDNIFGTRFNVKYSGIRR